LIVGPRMGVAAGGREALVAEGVLYEVGWCNSCGSRAWGYTVFVSVAVRKGHKWAVSPRGLWC